MYQMAPMSWITLMTMFILIYLIFSSMNFFNVNYTPITKTYPKLYSTLTWKW